MFDFKEVFWESTENFPGLPSLSSSSEAQGALAIRFAFIARGGEELNSSDEKFLFPEKSHKLTRNGWMRRTMKEREEMNSSEKWMNE